MQLIKLKSENKPKKYHSKAKIFIIIITSLTLIAVYDYAIGDNVRFYSKWVECRQKPVGTKGPGFFNTPMYYYKPSSFDLIRRPTGTYFCTPLEAEQAGYSAREDRYYFPNLKKTE